MRTLASALAVASAAALTSIPLSAQLQVDGLAGLGRVTLGPFDVNTSVGTNGALGVAYLNNEIFVSTRGNGASTTAPHTMYVYDTSGNMVRQFSQGANTSSSPWGWRDGDTDGVSLIFGHEGGINVFDVNGNLVNQIITAGGPVAISQPIQSGQTVSRAIAFDPAGNGGNGSLFVGDFGAAILEIDLTGNTLHTFPNPGGGDTWSAYGLAIDPSTWGAQRVRIWINSAPNVGPLREYVFDRGSSTVLTTGSTIERSLPGTAQGGLFAVRGGLDGRNCGFDLLGLDQGAPDTITGYRVQLWTGLDPLQEPLLVTGVNGGLRTPSVKTYSAAINTSFEFDLTKSGLQYVVFLTGNPTGYRPVGPLFGSFKEGWEWRILSAFTTPPGFSVATPTLTSGTPVSFNASVMNGLAPNDFAMQAMVIDPSIIGPIATCGGFLPLGITNVSGVQVRP